MTKTRRANGASIRAIRLAYGIRQGSLAAGAGISPGYLTRIEQGAQQPAFGVVRKIADVLGVELAAITYPVTVTTAVADDEQVPA